MAVKLTGQKQRLGSVLWYEVNMLPIIKTPIEILQTKTVDQLKVDLTAGMTKRDLLIELIGSETITSKPIRKYRRDGQIESQSEVFRDVETNKVIGTKQITWTYYKTGEVDEIAITENGKTKIIKHYLDRQPEVSGGK